LSAARVMERAQRDTKTSLAHSATPSICDQQFTASVCRFFAPPEKERGRK
jgi:hypothetical protein